MKALLKIVFSALSVFAAAYIIPGVVVDTVVTALIVAVVAGVLNFFVKPLLVFLTLPINILTLGLFTLVINAGIIWLTAYIVPGFGVANLWIALVFGVVTSLINSFLSMFLD